MQNKPNTQDAQPTALELIKQNRAKGALVFVDQNVQPQTKLYRLEATEITLDKDDIHSISGKIMPKREATDRIGEAAGITFLDVRGFTETRDDAVTGKHTVYIGLAQGKVRMPDGSWRTSTLQDYEFDPTLRAMLDNGITELTPDTRKSRKQKDDGTYGKSTGELILEYQKVGKQRAQTGARLRVIRELTGMPTALTKEQSAKPLVFARIVQNTDYILQTPEGRALATLQALGMDPGAVFGKRELPGVSAGTLSSENVTPEPEGEGGDPPGPGEKLAAQAAGGDRNDEFEQLSLDLENILETHKDLLNVQTTNNKNPYALGLEELNDFGATAETHRTMIGNLRKYLNKQGVEV